MHRANTDPAAVTCQPLLMWDDREAWCLREARVKTGHAGGLMRWESRQGSLLSVEDPTVPGGRAASAGWATGAGGGMYGRAVCVLEPELAARHGQMQWLGQEGRGAS